jgi:hypothetical protein
MNYKEFKAVFASLLLPLGYANVKNMFFRRIGDVFSIVELQKSDWGGNYYVNLGVFVDEGGHLPQPPPIHKAHLQQRLESKFFIPQAVRETLVPALNLEVPMRAAERSAVISNALEQYVIPYLNSISTIEGIADYISPDRGNVAFVTLKLRDIIRRRLHR